MVKKIFINYRRGDARSAAARIRDRLATILGEDSIFMDVENLAVGRRFDEALDKELEQCEVLLAVIGPRWLDLLKERESDPEPDYVRAEIAAALKRGITVIPVLVDGAGVPRQDALPEDVRNLVMHQGMTVTHEQFKRDIDTLVEGIVPGRSSRAQGTGSSRFVVGSLAAGAVIVLGGAFLLKGQPVLSPPAAKQAPAVVSSPQPVNEKAEASPAVSPKEAEVAIKAEDEDTSPKAPVADETHRPGRQFRDCPDVCPEMIVVGPGEFSMGSTDGDADEKPVRKVTIAKAFAAGRFEVTFAEWDACVDDGGCHRRPEADWGRDRQPVMRVSWDDITKEYLPWLSGKSGKTYRLLTEAEWEYAARAGTSTAFSTGRAIGRDHAAYADRRTVEVGTFPANPWGVYDLAGNVWEWVADCHARGYTGAPDDGTSAREEQSCVRVVRGGSWNTGAGELRSSNREWASPDTRNNDLGFRVARSL